MGVKGLEANADFSTATARGRSWGVQGRTVRGMLAVCFREE